MTHNWREILKAFCDEESSRFAMDKPWVKDGVLYATDGRTAVAGQRSRKLIRRQI